MRVSYNFFFKIIYDFSSSSSSSSASDSDFRLPDSTSQDGELPLPDSDGEGGCLSGCCLAQLVEDQRPVLEEADTDQVYQPRTYY